MKKLLIAVSILFIAAVGNAQTHAEKIATANDSVFKTKVALAAYNAAKDFVSDGNANINVKRFSQIILTTINNLDNDILVGLGYYLQSIPETVKININSSQQDIDFGMPYIYQLFAKAWYKDTN